MHINLASKALEISEKGSTMLMEVSLSRSSMTVPKMLNWNEITRDPVWNIQNATQPVKRQSVVVKIIEHLDGSVDVMFKKDDTVAKSQRI